MPNIILSVIVEAPLSPESPIINKRERVTVNHAFFDIVESSLSLDKKKEKISGEVEFLFGISPNIRKFTITPKIDRSIFSREKVIYLDKKSNSHLYISMQQFKYTIEIIEARDFLLPMEWNLLAQRLILGEEHGMFCNVNKEFHSFIKELIAPIYIKPIQDIYVISFKFHREEFKHFIPITSGIKDKHLKARHLKIFPDSLIF